MPDAVANPLTLVTDIKPPDGYSKLEALIKHLQGMPPDQNPITKALTELETVHFGRIVFIGETKLAVITSYDGELEDYIRGFINGGGHKIFNMVLPHIQDAPPLPVEDHPAEFLAFVKKYDLRCIPPFFSAYPNLRVRDILTLEQQADQS